MQSVDRALFVLEILARLGEAGVTDLATEIDVHKSTVSRLLTSLEDHDLVEQLQDRGKYRLGVGILRLANAVSGELDIIQQGREICERLAVDVGETVNVAVRRSEYVVNVDQARGPSSVGSHNWVGELTPLHATSSGKVLLALMSAQARRELLGAGPCAVHRPHDYVGRRVRTSARLRRGRRLGRLDRGVRGWPDRGRRADSRPRRHGHRRTERLGPRLPADETRCRKSQPASCRRLHRSADGWAIRADLRANRESRPRLRGDADLECAPHSEKLSLSSSRVSAWRSNISRAGVALSHRSEQPGSTAVTANHDTRLDITI